MEEKQAGETGQELGEGVAGAVLEGGRPERADAVAESRGRPGCGSTDGLGMLRSGGRRAESVLVGRIRVSISAVFTLGAVASCLLARV